MGFFSGLFRSRDKPQNRTTGSAYSFFFGGSSAGKRVNERSAMQITAVYSCVRILAEAVAGLPLQSTFGGSGNSNKIAVLEEGMKYTPIGISLEQAQFLETRKFQINEIARIFRVPPHMVGDLEKSSFSNIEQQSLEFVKYTLEPWLVRWEQSIQRTLLSPEEKKQYFAKFNVEGLLRGDYASRMTGYATARQNGWMSANDIRELENMDRIPAEEGGDLYLINGNMLPLGNAGAFANTEVSDDGKEEDSDEEVLEVEEPGGDSSGGTDAVPERHHRRGKLV